MIQLSGAGKRFGAKTLFQELDWLITPQDRVGLVGANGSGKSTLLKILAGLETLDYGALTIARGTTAGYLPQDGLTLSGRTVFEECLSVFDELRGMEAEMEQLNHRLADLDPAGAEYAAAADRLHHLQEYFRTHEGYALDAQVGTVLSGLGFGKQEWTRRTEEFSGGWQMRIALAKLLLQKPNLLLLDEPTNHLDLETRNWLEEYLGAYPYAYLVTSHDRYFLDVTVNRIVEIWNKRVYFYPGNYDRYLKQKEERRTQLEAAYRNQKARVDQLEAFINRFRYQPTKAKQVQSRIKELERMERVEIPPEERTIHFRFPQPEPSGRRVVEARGLVKSYGAKEVFREANFVIERGDRVALVGVNGAGKSTLIRLMAGMEPPTGGEMKLGHNVRADYFAQDQYKELDPDKRLLDDLWGLAPRYTQPEIRGLLGCFLFSEDEVFKKLGVLSGGERGRYALARILLQPSNFLLLDEPTNHLDLRAKDVLLEALAGYTGTLVFVSHDRYFIDKLATRVFEIAEGEVRVFPGNYEDYRWRKEHAGIEPQLVAAVEPDRAPENGDGTADVARASRRLNPQRRKQMENQRQELEARIEAAEAGIRETETALETFVSAAETARLSALLERRRAELDALLAHWEELEVALGNG
jgi:ATP-binding cassette subfamily F protein 3